MLSEDESQRLLADRVHFKLYAAESHLNNLKKIELKYGDLSKDGISIPVEIEIDCFLAQLVGAVDALLVQINERLVLGIPIEKVDLSTVQSALNARTKNIDLLTELHEASNHENWFWLLKDLRNHTMHRAMLRRMRDYDPFTEEIKVFLSMRQRKSMVNPINPPDYMNKEIVPYFEESLLQVRKLVETTREKEPVLKVYS
jgi:hypothetical protein